MAGHGWRLAFLGLMLLHQTVSAAGNPIAKIAQTGDAIEWERDVEGQTVTISLPLYRSGDVRYFSAGVGLEERSAEYPTFPLKVIFTAGGKPFLSGIAVTIQSSTGPAIGIPREHVDGPWLFVDLAPGLYEVTAAYGDLVQRLKDVKVEAGKQRVVYLRWKDDQGMVLNRGTE